MSAATFRDEVLDFLDEHLTDEVIEQAYKTGTVHNWEFHQALAKKGWLDRNAMGDEKRQILTTLFERAGAPTHGWNIAEMVAHILEIVGTPEQKTQVVAEVYRGDALICLGYSEPDVGSDIASVSTRAVRDGDGWIINGQKMFTSMAHESSYVFLLTRTNTEVERHRGLTVFLVPLDTPGVEVREIETLGGERTNVTFYTDVRVPDSSRVGDVDAGWNVMKVALAFERQSPANGEAERMLERTVEWCRETGALRDPSVRLRLARVALDLHIGSLLDERVYLLSGAEGAPVAEASIAKLWTTESLQRNAGNLLDIVGSEGVLQHGEPTAPVNGWIEHAHRYSQVYTIFGGTSEIQRSIIAERGLGLPRGR